MNYRPAKKDEGCYKCGSEACIALADVTADALEQRLGEKPPKYTLCPYCYETTLPQEKPYGASMCQALNLMENRIVQRLMLEIKAARK